LGAADAALGATAKALAEKLARAQPKENGPRLVHGTLYDRHLLDLGDGAGAGVIDWQRSGQGPLEIDAAMFLATIWRRGLRSPAVAAEAARAERTLLAGTAGLLDERALAWHRAAALLRLAGKVQLVSGRKPDWQARVQALVGEAARLAERAARLDAVARAERSAPFTLKGSALELALRALSSTLNGSALEFALQALSTTLATPDELDRIRRLLVEMSAEKKGP